MTGVSTVREARVTLHRGKAVAVCPDCDARYDVTEVLGDSRYDRDPHVPGQQGRCRKCGAVFTLPDEPGEPEPPGEPS